MRMRMDSSRVLNFVMIVGCITTAAAAVMTHGMAAAVVGAPQMAERKTAPAISPEQLKAQYRRPASLPFPKDNPYTTAKAELGKALFFDTRLSGGSLLSCASCHNPGFGWGDGLPKGIGHGMVPLGRRSPSIVNAAFGQAFMWDGRAASLEEQALGPIEAGVEMNLPIDELMKRLGSVPGYDRLFRAAFPNEGISPLTVAKALATYERTVVSGRAPFDAWIEGDETAIPEGAKRGFLLFNGKAGCANCHSGWNLTDDSFHDIGLADADIGRGKIVPQVVKMQHAFKTPGLREISRRGPYMHDGSIGTLRGVIERYDDGGVDRPSRSDLVKPLGLSEQEKSDLESFLKSLTSEGDSTTVPVLPR
jgi:cytochrome c peroxidase